MRSITLTCPTHFIFATNSAPFHRLPVYHPRKRFLVKIRCNKQGFLTNNRLHYKLVRQKKMRALLFCRVTVEPGSAEAQWFRRGIPRWHLPSQHYVNGCLTHAGCDSGGEITVDRLQVHGNCLLEFPSTEMSPIPDTLHSRTRESLQGHPSLFVVSMALAFLKSLQVGFRFDDVDSTGLTSRILRLRRTEVTFTQLMRHSPKPCFSIEPGLKPLIQA